MKITLFIAGFILFVSLLSSCDSELIKLSKYPKFLDYKNTVGLETKLYKERDQEYLHVSGFSGHSALSIVEITQELSGNVLILKIELTPVNPRNKDGNFSVELKLNSKITKVAILDKEDVIWDRKP